jgi:hypothetical protein
VLANFLEFGSTFKKTFDWPARQHNDLGYWYIIFEIPKIFGIFFLYFFFKNPLKFFYRGYKLYLFQKNNLYHKK